MSQITISYVIDSDNFDEVSLERERLNIEEYQLVLWKIQDALRTITRLDDPKMRDKEIFNLYENDLPIWLDKLNLGN